MSLAVNFLPLLVPLLLAAGIAFRSRMLIAVSFGAIPLALVIAIMGPQIAFGSPEIILFLAASSLCSAGLAWQVQTRITQRMIRVRKAQKGPRS